MTGPRRWYLRVKVACLGLLAAFLALNGMAYMQARGMTHFRPPGDGAWRGPETLSAAEKAWLLVAGPRIARPSGPERPDGKAGGETVTFQGGAGRLEAWHFPRPGSDAAALVFHGYTRCKAQMVPEARAWNALGLDCLLVDFRGSGGSAGDVTTFGYHEADDVAAAVTYARTRWPGKRIVLFGHSMGAVAALRALARGVAHADAAVLECPYDRMETAVGVRFKAAGLPAFPLARLVVYWAGAQHGLDGFAHNPVDYARAVTCPVRLLQGDRDARVAVRDAEAIRDALGGEARYHLFAGIGHESYVSKDEAGWKAVVKAFLDAPRAR